MAIDCDPEAWAIMPINPTGMGFEEFWATACGAPIGEGMACAIRSLSDKTVVEMSSTIPLLRVSMALRSGPPLCDRMLGEAR